MQQLHYMETINGEVKNLSVSKKQRYLYLFLFGIPSILITLGGFLIVYMIVLAFYLPVALHGDNTTIYNIILGILTIILICAVPVVIFILARKGFFFGKKRDIANMPININHIILSIIITVGPFAAFYLFIIKVLGFSSLYQFFFFNNI